MYQHTEHARKRRARDTPLRFAIPGLKWPLGIAVVGGGKQVLVTLDEGIVCLGVLCKADEAWSDALPAEQFIHSNGTYMYVCMYACMYLSM